uniref:DnaJ homolog subfamily A member 2-like n=1 Tax=Phallusia mammillata TaxID=59560 RepID=A0A6F9DBQ2_9ASCI|nr:dnaJ homolog subfamily A member 2-like [Phallusia mammillata]
MDQNKSLYDVLKLKSSCSGIEIQEAWIKAKNSYKVSSTEYTAASKAFRILSDPEKRVMYNSFGIEDFDFSRFNNDFYFSDKVRQHPSAKEYQKIKLGKKPSDIFRDLPVSLEDLYNGKQITIKQQRNTICPQCKGTPSFVQCPSCTKLQIINRKCLQCNGKKIVEQNICEKCKGKTHVTEEKLVPVSVVKGMKHGEIIRLVGFGNDFSSNSNNATDLVLVLKQRPHIEFKRYGNDLYVTKNISLSEALCGYKTVLTHLDGRKLLISSGDTVLAPGCKKIVKGEGMPINCSNDQEKGDLIYIFQVTFPDSLSKNILKDVENCLPHKPTFAKPDDHELDVLQLTEFDPSFKFQKRRTVYDDEKPNIQLSSLAKERCMHQ